MKKENYTQKVFDLLKTLKKEYPSIAISTHISGVLSEYDNNNFWGTSDKELFFALERYSEELAFDGGSDDLTIIIEEGMHLDTFMSRDEEDYEYS